MKNSCRLHPFLSAALVLLSFAAVADATCPNYSIAVKEGDTCDGNMTLFNEAFGQLYVALMRYDALIGQLETSGPFSDRIDMPLGELAEDAEDHLHEVVIGETDITAIYESGMYHVSHNTNERRLQEEAVNDLVEGEVEQGSSLRQLQDPDCGTREWCLPFPWCCTLCPHHCDRRNRALQFEDEFGLTSHSSTPTICDFLETHIDELPGCLAGAVLECRVH